MGSCRQTATEEPYSIFWRLYPRLFDSTCVNVSPCTLDRPVARLVTPAGSCTALSMESSLTVTCPPTRPSEMIPSQLSSLKPELEHTGSCSAPSSSSTERRTPPTPTPEATTPSARRWLTLCWTGSGSWLTCAPASKVSSSSTPSEEEPGPDSPLFSWNVCLSTMERSPSWSSPSTLLLRLPPPSLSPTMPSSPPTPLWSTPTVPSWSTTRPSTTSAVGTSTSRGRPTPT